MFFVRKSLFGSSSFLLKFIITSLFLYTRIYSYIIQFDRTKKKMIFKLAYVDFYLQLVIRKVYNFFDDKIFRVFYSWKFKFDSYCVLVTTTRFELASFIKNILKKCFTVAEAKMFYSMGMTKNFLCFKLTLSTAVGDRRSGWMTSTFPINILIICNN